MVLKCGVRNYISSKRVPLRCGLHSLVPGGKQTPRAGLFAFKLRALAPSLSSYDDEGSHKLAKRNGEPLGG